MKYSKKQRRERPSFVDRLVNQMIHNVRMEMIRKHRKISNG